MKYKAIRKIKWGFYTLMHAISTKEFYWGDIAKTMSYGVYTGVSKDTQRLQKFRRACTEAFGFSYNSVPKHNSHGVGEIHSVENFNCKQK